MRKVTFTVEELRQQREFDAQIDSDFDITAEERKLSSELDRNAKGYTYRGGKCERHLKYYLANREEILKRSKKRRDEHKQELNERRRVLYREKYGQHAREYKRKYHQEHKAERNEKCRNYYQQNIESLRAKHNEYYRTHKEEISARRKAKREMAKQEALND